MKLERDLPAAGKGKASAVSFSHTTPSCKDPRSGGRRLEPMPEHLRRGEQRFTCLGIQPISLLQVHPVNEPLGRERGVSARPWSHPGLPSGAPAQLPAAAPCRANWSRPGAGGAEAPCAAPAAAAAIREHRRPQHRAISSPSPLHPLLLIRFLLQLFQEARGLLFWRSP